MSKRNPDAAALWLKQHEPPKPKRDTSKRGYWKRTLQGKARRTIKLLDLSDPTVQTKLRRRARHMN